MVFLLLLQPTTTKMQTLLFISGFCGVAAYCLQCNNVGFAAAYEHFAPLCT